MSVKSVCVDHQWHWACQCIGDRWCTGCQCSSDGGVSVSVLQWSLTLNLWVCAGYHCRCQSVFSKLTPSLSSQEGKSWHAPPKNNFKCWADPDGTLAPILHFPAEFFEKKLFSVSERCQGRSYFSIYLLEKKQEC